MILQPTTPKYPLTSPNQGSSHLNLSSTIPKSLSFSSGLLQNSVIYLKKPIISTFYLTHKNPVFITCSSVASKGRKTVDFEGSTVPKWKEVNKKISGLSDPTLEAGSVLNQVEKEGSRLTKWEVCRIVKELRKYRRYKYALQVYEWMNNRGEKYRTNTSDTAIQLDLIAKVHGISSAEEYFHKLPDALKDKRIYGSLLNAFVRVRMKERAESLMDTMRGLRYACHALPYNVMMTLYMNLKENEKIDSLVAEMNEKSIALDTYSYNIWLSSYGNQRSLEKMEHVYGRMQLDSNITPNWTTFCTMATMYIKLEEFAKGEDCLRKIESRITRQDRMQYHYLISLYGGAGKKDDVYRIWSIYKGTFTIIPNLGYHAVIASLVRLNDIEGAEKIYNEWWSVKSNFDPRLGNLLLSWYVKNAMSKKVKACFDQMIDGGGKPNSMTWEILAEDHIKNRKIREAMSCLKNAAFVEGSKSWRPKPINVSTILKISEQDEDVAIKDVMFEVLKKVGCLDDVGYMSYIPVLGGGTFTSVPIVDEGEDADGDFELLGDLQESV